MVYNIDKAELKRISTNSNKEDRSCMNRIINGISELEKENNKLNFEIRQLKHQLGIKVQD